MYLMIIWFVCTKIFVNLKKSISEYYDNVIKNIRNFYSNNNPNMHTYVHMAICNKFNKTLTRTASNC